MSLCIHHLITHTGGITTELLNETNYLQWSIFAKMFTGAKEKMNYIDGTAKQPDPKDPKYKEW